MRIVEGHLETTLGAPFPGAFAVAVPSPETFWSQACCPSPLSSICLPTWPGIGQEGMEEKWTAWRKNTMEIETLVQPIRCLKKLHWLLTVEI